jgi:hypothetical protein
MAFTVSGSIRSRKYKVTYEGPGKLSGDRLAVDLVKIEAATRPHVEGPVGHYYTGNYLDDPLAALSLIQNVFTAVDEVTGDVPTAEEVDLGEAGDGPAANIIY